MKIKPISNRPGYLAFYCKGCEEHHVINTIPNGNAPVWTYNGNADKPTVRASVLFRSGHYLGSEGKNKDGGCWCTYNASQLAKGETTSPFTCTVCHSFVTDGRIEYLSDCTHQLAGQTIELPDLD